MTTIAYTLNVPFDVGSRVTRQSLVDRVNQALSNNGGYNVACVDAETRVNSVLGMRRVILVITMGVTRRDGRPLDATSFVMLDSIAFGAMKASAGQGWSVMEIRQRLNPVGTSSESYAATLLPGRDVTGASRTVSETGCSLASVQGFPGQTLTVLDGATPGATRNNAPVLPPALTDMPWYYKAAIGAGVTLVAAIGVGYVVRSFK